MEIVEAQGVREVLFDAQTGRPVRPSAEPAGPTPNPASSAPAGPIPNPVGPTPTAVPAPAAAPAAAAAKMLEEFPIEFNAPK